MFAYSFSLVGYGLSLELRKNDKRTARGRGDQGGGELTIEIDSIDSLIAEMHAAERAQRSEERIDHYLLFFVCDVVTLGAGREIFIH